MQRKSYEAIWNRFLDPIDQSPAFKFVITPPSVSASSSPSLERQGTKRAREESSPELSQNKRTRALHRAEKLAAKEAKRKFRADQQAALEATIAAQQATINALLRRVEDFEKLSPLMHKKADLFEAETINLRAENQALRVQVNLLQGKIDTLMMQQTTQRPAISSAELLGLITNFSAPVSALDPTIPPAELVDIDEDDVMMIEPPTSAQPFIFAHECYMNEMSKGPTSSHFFNSPERRTPTSILSNPSIEEDIMELPEKPSA